MPSSAYLHLYKRLNQAQFTKLLGVVVDADGKKPKIPLEKAKYITRNTLKTKEL